MPTTFFLHLFNFYLWGNLAQLLVNIQILEPPSPPIYDGGNSGQGPFIWFHKFTRG